MDGGKNKLDCLVCTNVETAISKPVPATDAATEYQEVAWGIPSVEKPRFEPLFVNRTKPTGHQVKFEMLYCGVCHSDVHIGLNHLTGTMYPVVPGHELVGRVVEIGDKVTKVKVGDNVGVGVMIDACLSCNACKDGQENYCDGGFTHTYNSTKKKPEEGGHIGGNPDGVNYGGYSASNTVHEHFIIKIPDSVPLEKAGPILCAGITLFDPLVHWGCLDGKKKTVGVAGIGGLGTMGIKLAKAMGHNVIAISTTAAKEGLAKEKGADGFCISKDPESLKAHENTMDLILNTVSSAHEVETYLPLLRVDGTIVQLGLVKDKHSLDQMMILPKRKSIAGSCIGGMPAHVKLLEFCGTHGIAPDIKLIEASQLDEAWAELNTHNADGVRFVIDIKKSLANKDFCPKQ